ncbi:MAG TPA: substrate-binding domain-containing protein [Roseiflexaceae bacterium]|nr:substrate-binding domain-containing protein [Roseiflexaceae bacterium]
MRTPLARFARLLPALVALTLLAACGTAPTATAPSAAPAAATAPIVEGATAAPAATAEPAGQPTAAQPATGEPIKIGVISDLSKNLKYYGEMQLNGLKAGIDYATDGTFQVNGRPIEILPPKDDEGNPEKGAALARELIEKDGAEILQCCASSSVALAVIEVAKQFKKVAMIDPAASPAITGTNFNRYVFRTGRNTFQDAATAGPYLVKNVGAQFVQIAPDNDFGKGSAASWRSVIEQAGGSWSGDDVLIPPDTTDFTPYLQKILDSDAKVLFVTWAGASFVPLFKQMQEQGIFEEKTVATGFGDNATLPAVYKEALGSVGMIAYHYTLPKTPANDWLVAYYQKNFNRQPDLFDAGGMAAGIAIVEGLKKTGGDPEAEALIGALEGLSFEGPKGTYTFRKEDHQALQPMYMVKLVNIDSPDKKFFELVQEVSPQDSAPPVVPPKQ